MDRRRLLTNDAEIIRLYRDERWPMNRVAAHCGISARCLKRTWKYQHSVTI
jgi:hypothetical protein